MRLITACCIVALLIGILTFAACEKEGVEALRYYTIQVPIYALRADVQDIVERQMPQPGTEWSLLQILPLLSESLNPGFLREVVGLAAVLHVAQVHHKYRRGKRPVQLVLRSAFVVTGVVEEWGYNR